MSGGECPEPRARDLVDRIADALPEDVRSEYYRELVYCRSLAESDELLRILRAMQFLTLLMDGIPGRVAAERAGMESVLSRCSSALSDVETRLTSLPEEVARNLGPETIAERLNEALRQQFFRTTLPETARLLTTAADAIGRSVEEFAAAAKAIDDAHRGAAAEAGAAVKRIEAAIEFTTRASRSATGHLSVALLRLNRLSLFIGGAALFLLGMISALWLIRR